jgi:hypothetical protein
VIEEGKIGSHIHTHTLTFLPIALQLSEIHTPKLNPTRDTVTETNKKNHTDSQCGLLDPYLNTTRPRVLKNRGKRRKKLR